MLKAYRSRQQPCAVHGSLALTGCISQFVTVIEPTPACSSLLEIEYEAAFTNPAG